MVDRDEELHGRSPNAKAFVLVSDGQAWSGEVQQALALATEKRIPVFVVGVGTVGGGIIPEPPPAAEKPAPLRPAPSQPRIVDEPAAPPKAGPIRSSLDRASLQMIAARGGGRYFELDRETDTDIANTIVDEVRQRQNSREGEERAEDLYWLCLLAAASF